MPRLEVRTLPVAKLKPARYNPRKPPKAHELETYILKAWRKRRTGRALRAACDRFVSRYQHLLAYEKTKGFPDHLIARTSITSYYHQLISSPTRNSEYVERTMARTWGPTWRSKLDSQLELHRKSAYVLW